MLRGLRAPEVARSIAKNFDQVAFRYDAVVLFRHRFRRLFIPGGGDVLGSATVGSARRDWLPRGRWFRLSDEQFDSLHYLGMSIYKIGILLFNLVPFIVLCIIG